MAVKNGRQPARRIAGMKALRLLDHEASLGLPTWDLNHAEQAIKTAAKLTAAAHVRVRICMEQGYGKSMPRKQRLS